MVGIVTLIDSSLVQGQVQRVLLEDPACWALYQSFVDFAPLESAIAAWKEGLEAQGIQLFLLSNSRRPGRAQQFAERLGIPYQGHSGKPKRAGYRRAMERMGAAPEETVMVGDQIFTDILGANRAGVIPLLVKPIRLAGNPGRYLRYAVETPFRLLGKRRPFL